MKDTSYLMGDGRSETGHELGILKRPHHKKTIPLPCQHLGTTGSLLQLCTQGLQNNIDDATNGPDGEGQPLQYNKTGGLLCAVFSTDLY